MNIKLPSLLATVCTQLCLSWLLELPAGECMCIARFIVYLLCKLRHQPQIGFSTVIPDFVYETSCISVQPVLCKLLLITTQDASHCSVLVLHSIYTRTAQVNDLQNVNLKSRTAQKQDNQWVLYTSMVLSTMNPTLNGPKPFSPAPALIYACNDTTIGYQQGKTILQQPNNADNKQQN